MVHEVRFSARATRDLDAIPPRIVTAIIEFAYGDLARNPRRLGKPLKRELEGYHSARRGPYRLLYRIDDEAGRVDIVRVDHRSDVYRRS